ncbi:hypothetical protein D3C81_1364470 [compost metagenome]
MPRFPVGTGKLRIFPFFYGKLHAGFDQQVVDFLIKRIVVLHGLLGFPTDALEREQMVQAKRAKANCPILAVRVLRLQHFDIVDIDDVVQHPRLDRYEPLQHASRHRAGQVDRVQVADDEVARNFGHDDPGLPVLRYQFLLLDDRRRLVLHDFRTQVGGVNHPVRAVRVRSVDRIAIEHVRRTGLQL